MSIVIKTEDDGTSYLLVNDTLLALLDDAIANAECVIWERSSNIRQDLENDPHLNQLRQLLQNLETTHEA